VVTHLATHLGHELAVVAHLDFGQALGIGHHQIGQLDHQLAALGGAHAGPGALAQRARGSLDGQVHILGRAARNLGPGFAGVGIDGVEPLTFHRINILAVDEMLVLLHGGS